MINQKKRNLFLIILLTSFMVLAVSGVTYAFFAAVMVGDETSTVVDFTSTVVSLDFADGETNAIITDKNILPGWSNIKKFSVTGTNTTTDRTVYYDVILHVTENTFSADGVLKYELAVNSGTGALASSGNVPIKSGDFKLFGVSKPSIGPNSSNVVHNYSFKLLFPNDEFNPQYEQGATFKGYITISSDTQISKDSNYNK